MFDLTKAKVYVVGGYTRDRLLGLEPNDHDFVVVGATPEMMESFGFSQVGADFPVYLHSVTNDEYALARTETKTGPGYHGFETNFDPSVTLDEDLSRRDLTINAMAREVIGWNEQGHAKLSDEIIDPWLGQLDLKDGIIRHVSSAFKDDPVRVLRAARFAARYDFSVDEETLVLMTRMVHAGELDHLTAERVWLEMEKSMKGERPGDFFRILDRVGALKKVMPLVSYHVDDVICAVDKVNGVKSRFAVMALGLGEEKIAEFFDSLKAPVDIKRWAVKTEALRRIVSRHGLTPAIHINTGEFIPAKPLTTDAVIEIFTRLDVKRSPAEFDLCVSAFTQIREIPELKLLMKARDAFLAVSFSDIPDGDQLQGLQIADELNTRRRVAVELVLNS